MSPESENALRQFLKDVEECVKARGLGYSIVDLTENVVKVRVQITENIFVQVYYNRASGVRNYVLIGWNKRLFGRDCVGGSWHRHPFEDPEQHDFSGEGAKEVSVCDFIDEVITILKEEGII